MPRTFRVVSYLAVFAAGVAAGGLFLRLSSQEPPLPLPARQPDTATVAAVPTSPPADVMRYLADGRVEDAVAALERQERMVSGVIHQQLRDQVLAHAGMWIGNGRREDAKALIDAYLEIYPRDHRALFHAADLAQMVGDWLEAVAYLYRVLEYPPDRTVVGESRRRIRVLVRSHAAGLIQRREFETLVEFYEHLIGLDPINDDYRLAAAEWLLEIGEIDRADAWLGETPASDRRHRLLARSRLRQAGIAVRQANRQLVADAVVAGETVQLLVDTGASMTSVSPPVLERVGARPTGSIVTVATASGTIDARVYVVEALQVGPLMLSNHQVLGLDLGNPAIDGLLGMDVLELTGLPSLETDTDIP